MKCRTTKPVRKLSRRAFAQALAELSRGRFLGLGLPL